MHKFIKTMLLLVIITGSNTTFAQYKVTFVIQQLPVKDSGENIFLAGNFNNWSPGDSSFKFIHTSQITSEIILPKGDYEYKLTRGNWQKAETDKTGQGISNRVLQLNSDTTIYIDIAGWNDHFNPAESKIVKHTASKNVHIIDTAFYIPQLSRYRRIWIYLPSDYTTSNRSYGVLYMHDGQNLFDDATSYSGEWGVDEHLDSIISQGKKPVMVVGIDNGLNKRMNEYNAWEFQNFGKGEGDQYVDFLVKTLKPFIDSSYRTFKNKQNTYIAGSSMGGLISLYAVIKYPKVFGGAGIFSPAFWTAYGIDSLAVNNAGKIDSRLFFYAGGKEGESMVPGMQRIRSIFKSGSPSKTEEFIDQQAGHNEAAWRKYFPAFYEWTILNSR